MIPALSSTYNAFFASERSAGLLLAACTVFSLVVANTPLGPSYIDLFQFRFGGLSVQHWINDALMAVFFLFVGLELERELYNGELSSLRTALLPMIAAMGGIVVPTAIHFALNQGTASQAGAGIPMATDIAFSLAVLALLASRIPASLKIFLTAVAVVDDLGAIIAISVFYTSGISAAYLYAALAVFALLLFLNRRMRVMALTPYLAGGIAMWILLLRSGIHPTISGVLLAFAIPFSKQAEDAASPSHRMENFLHAPVAFFILPLFALANTCIPIPADWPTELLSANSMGIAMGLVIGKPLGIFAFSAGAVAVGLCRLPADMGWRHVAGAGMLAGIGFTMSIFIAHLAFAGDPRAIDAAKVAILVASAGAGLIGYAWLRWVAAPRAVAAGSAGSADG